MTRGTAGLPGELLLHAGLAHGLAAPLRLALAGIALAAVAVPTAVVLGARGPRAAHDVVLLPDRARAGPPPAVDPVRLVDLAPDAARAFNARQPFAAGPLPPARPFRFAGDAADRARAADCLAAAAVYEAGDDAAGERAVAQVVLNRLRHPAFPKSVCAVVFEGSERATGCQFTFTCDGALARWHPTEAAWTRARAVAAMALAGSVDRAVGLATHYHTDWVVPYWQASLDKIARVGPHLFFRWQGWWGTPPAFDRRAAGPEPVVALLAPVSDAHRGDAALADGAASPALPFFGRTLRPLAGDPDTFLTSVDPARPPESYRALALQACGERAHCKVLGWSDPGAMAFALPVSAEAQAALSFSYLRDRASGFERALWNCAEFRQAPPGACMKRAVAARPARAADALPEPLDAAPGEPGPAPLKGVRRRGTSPRPAPSDPAV